VSSVTIKPDTSAENWEITNPHGALLPIVIVAAFLLLVFVIASWFWRRFRRNKIRQMLGNRRSQNQQQFAQGQYAGGQYPHQGPYPPQSQYPPQNQYALQQMRY
jgi:hypothetical protein